MSIAQVEVHSFCHTNRLLPAVSLQLIISIFWLKALLTLWVTVSSFLCVFNNFNVSQELSVPADVGGGQLYRGDSVHPNLLSGTESAYLANAGVGYSLQTGNRGDVNTSIGSYSSDVPSEAQLLNQEHLDDPEAACGSQVSEPLGHGHLPLSPRKANASSGTNASLAQWIRFTRL